MPETSTNSINAGIGFPGLLTVLFIGLKLGHVIDWPWVWVLSPVWIPFAILIMGLLIVAILAFIADGATGYKKPKR